jgi:transposase
LVLEEGQRELLESVARSGTSQHRLVQRARVLLAAADGLSNSEIASRVGVSRPTVLAWRAEFAQRGLWRFGQVAPGRGRKPSIPQEIVDRVVELTLHHRPEGATHWSVRSMARQVGISPATVQRIWDARGLKPHLVETFKLSTDARGSRRSWLMWSGCISTRRRRRWCWRWMRSRRSRLIRGRVEGLRNDR